MLFIRVDNSLVPRPQTTHQFTEGDKLVRTNALFQFVMLDGIIWILPVA